MSGPWVTATSPIGHPLASSPSGAIGGNSMITGLAIQANPSAVYTFIQNLSYATPLYISFGLPVSATQFNIVLNPLTSGDPNVFTSPGMLQVPIWVSGGSFLAWSM